MEFPQLELIQLEGLLAVCKLHPSDPIPSWATTAKWFSVTRTADEVSIVCPQTVVPAGVKCEPNWRCLRVAGAMPFSMVGVLASLTAPLAHAGIGVFALSTFDTDYLLVPAKDFDKALHALRQHGHTISA
jgi:hypothetical protein